jgi:fluoride exporter
MLVHYIAVGLGGALGAVSRVALSNLLPGYAMGMPLPIMLVNVFGCFLMGILAEVMALYWSGPDYIKYLLVPGFLGGFTTFSSFALEFGGLVEKDAYLPAMGYVTLSVVLSLSCFFLGTKLIRMI